MLPSTVIIYLNTRQWHITLRMIIKGNNRISGKHHLSHTIIAVLFSVTLIFGISGVVGSPLQQQQPQQQQQEAYASSQAAVPPSQKAPPPTQAASFTPICNPNSPTLQPGSTGAKVTELQRALTQIGYGPFLGKSGIDGKFGLSTQNAVKKFQQDYKIPVDGKVGLITWGALCRIVPNSFIIQLRFTDRERIGTLVADLAAAGGKIAAIYDQFKMFNVRFERPPTNAERFINSLKAHPAVQGVFYDATATLSQFHLNLPSQIKPEGIDRVDADLSGAKSGDGVGNVDADIAIIDSGVTANHPDLNVFQCVSFLADKPLPSCEDDSGLDGHGTPIAGIAAAKDNNIGVVGTAPGARIWALKVIGAKGEGDISNILKALNYVAANAKDIEVVNLSFGNFGLNIAEFVAIHDVISKGVVVVVAAGNNNIDAKYWAPAMHPAVITVSAITDSDGKCGGMGFPIRVDPAVNGFQGTDIDNPDDFFRSSSNFGSVVDLAAPGSQILTTRNLADATKGYAIKSGTSMAAPHVAGAVALYRSSHTANPAQVEDFLKSIGTKAPASGNLLVPCDGKGRGYFNDRYPRIPVITDQVKEPLLYMGNIR